MISEAVQLSFIFLYCACWQFSFQIYHLLFPISIQFSFLSLPFSHQAVVGQLSSCQAVVRQSSGCHSEVVKQAQGIPRAVIGKSLGNLQTVHKQSLDNHCAALQTERIFSLVQITDQTSETSFELDRNYCSCVNKHFSSKRKISFKQNESIYLKDGIITYKQNSNEYIPDVFADSIVSTLIQSQAFFFNLNCSN